MSSSQPLSLSLGLCFKKFLSPLTGAPSRLLITVPPFHPVRLWTFSLLHRKVLFLLVVILLSYLLRWGRDGYHMPFLLFPTGELCRLPPRHDGPLWVHRLFRSSTSSTRVCSTPSPPKRLLTTTRVFDVSLPRSTQGIPSLRPNLFDFISPFTPSPVSSLSTVPSGPKDTTDCICPYSAHYSNEDSQFISNHLSDPHVSKERSSS